MARGSEEACKKGRPLTAAPECEQAALEVLETMFFEIPSEVPEVKKSPPRAAVAARAVFGGDLSGCLVVACEEWAARRLAANFLGREDEGTVGEDEVRMVTCEMANMICGNALSRIKPHGRFRIGTPQAEPVAEPQREWLTVPLESGEVAVSFRLLEG